MTHTIRTPSGNILGHRFRQGADEVRGRSLFHQLRQRGYGGRYMRRSGEKRHGGVPNGGCLPTASCFFQGRQLRQILTIFLRVITGIQVFLLRTAVSARPGDEKVNIPGIRYLYFVFGHPTMCSVCPSKKMTTKQT